MQLPLIQTGPTEPTDPAKRAATVLLLGGATTAIALATIDFLLRNHKHGLRAEPKGEGPGPKH